MKTLTARLCSVTAVSLAVVAFPASAKAERYLLEPVYPTDAMPRPLVGSNPGATVTSGGNVASSPANSPKNTAGTIFLAESSIGYLGPTLEAGISTKQDLSNAASAELASGTHYKATGVAGNWQIVFPGVVDVSTGGQAPGTQNFYANRVTNAVDYYRALTLAYPNDVQLKIAFINAMRDLMVPHTYAGNNAFARATKERIINGPLDVPLPPEQGNPSATDREDAVLQNATGMYDIAADYFVDLMGSRDSMMAAFPASLPPGMTETTPDVLSLRSAQQGLCTAFARSIGFKAESVLRTYQLKYLKGYLAPTATNSLPAATLVNALDLQTRAFDYYLLLAASLEPNAWFNSAEFTPARAFNSNMKNLRDAMHQGVITFTGLDSSLNIKPNAYGWNYIPFFFDPTINATQPTTFAGLMAFARPLATSSTDADTGSVGAIGQLDLNLQTLAQRLNDVNDQFNAQLGQLCGFKSVIINGQPRLAPDTDGAILPPEKRPNWQSRTRTDQGEIGQQWLEIDAAELALEKALTDMENLLDTIDNKRETWRLIKGSREDMIQNVILATGEKMAQLDKDASEARARFAEYQAALAKKKKKRGLFGGVFGAIASAVAVAAAPFTGGATLSVLGYTVGVSQIVATAASLAGSAAELSTAYSQASIDIKGIRAQADLDRKLGQIEARKTELAYLERAGIQFQQITEDGYRTEEAINALLLEVKTAELQVEMAELRVDQNYIKLSTMLNRVSYLMQQHAAAFSLVDSNPLNSPDFRIIRDRTVRESEERFLFAQEWAFLTGRAATYLALGSDRRANIDTINTEILKARTGKRLAYLLDRLQAEMNFVTIDLGSRTNPSPTLVSLRDYVFQHNAVQRLANGNPDPDFTYPNAATVWEAQSVTTNGVTTAGSTQAFSDQAWTALLRSLYTVDPNTGIAQLQIPFRLSLTRWADLLGTSNLDPLDRIENPLFSASQYGAVIYYSASLPEAFGVRIDILGSGITGIGTGGTTITATLSPQGSSYIRQRGYTADPTGRQNLIFQFGRDKSNATIQASLNGVPATLRNPQLHERSPANDRWVLTITSDTQQNRTLLQQLDKIRDIRISFSVASYTE